MSPGDVDACCRGCAEHVDWSGSPDCAAFVLLRNATVCSLKAGAGAMVEAQGAITGVLGDWKPGVKSN